MEDLTEIFYVQTLYEAIKFKIMSFTSLSLQVKALNDSDS